MSVMSRMFSHSTNSPHFHTYLLQPQTPPVIFSSYPSYQPRSPCCPCTRTNDPSLNPPTPHQPSLPPLHPPRLHNNKPYKIPTKPITAMRPQHRQILYLQRTTSIPQEKINGPVVVEQEKALLGELFACEVVGFELHC